MTLNVGIIGCGNISDTYLKNALLFRDLNYTACADLRPEAALAKATEYNIQALTIDELLKSEEIDIVLNLTVPTAHAEISIQALQAGKHVYCEKPMAASLAEAQSVLNAANNYGKVVGVAPDTIIGPGVQTARKILDQGSIGEVVGGLAAVLSHGMEDWHPNPEFFYKRGGGPILDLGPYYVSALIHLLGPIRAVQAVGNVGYAERLITADGPNKGKSVKVETYTTVSALLRFRNGTDIPFLASWDVWSSDLRPIELHGTRGTLRVPNPNVFGGAVAFSTQGGTFENISTSDLPFGADNRLWAGQYPYTCYRGLGMADMANGIQSGKPARASAELGFHTLEVLLAIEEAIESHGEVTIHSVCGRPEILSPSEARSLMAR